MKCANCSREAVYYLNNPGANPVYYCAICLPKHLQKRADAGQLRLPEKAAPAKPKASEPKAE